MVSRPPQSPRPRKIRKPIDAATRPGIRIGIRDAPSPTPASISSIPATSGPPNKAEIAENEPAVDNTFVSRSSARANPARATPTTDPSAISGASGPRTAPNASEASAASAIPGPCAIGVGATLMPTSGLWPPSPGRSRRAARTRHAPTSGRPRTRYQGGLEASSRSGRSCHSQCSTSWTAATKSAATRAAGTPTSAPNPTRRSTCRPETAAVVSGELTGAPYRPGCRRN